MQQAAAAKLPRIPSLDGMRFVMCLGIAIFHFSPYFFEPNEAGYHHTRKFAYFTDIFFIISGFFLARSNMHTQWSVGQVVRFLGLRLARVYPLHVACLGFFAAIGVAAYAGLVTPENPERYVLYQVIPNLLLVQSWGLGDSHAFNYVSWALSALWLMYILFPLMSVLARRSVWALALLVGVTLLGGEWLTASLYDDALAKAQDYHMGILRGLPSFLFGVWLAHIGAHGVGRGPALFGLGVIGLAVVGLPLLEGSPRLIAIYALLFFFLAADAASLPTPLSWPPLARLAPFSFGIYLIHPVVATVLFALLLPTLPFPSVAEAWPSWFLALGGLGLGLTVTFFAAMLTYHLLEKPAERFIAARIVPRPTRRRDEAKAWKDRTSAARQ